MTSMPNPEAPARDAVLRVAASDSDAVLRLSEHPDIAVPLALPAADLLQALAERARSDAARRTEAWGDRFSLNRAYQRVFNKQASTEQLEVALTQLGNAMQRHRLGLDSLVQKNRKTGAFRLNRPLRIEFSEARS